MKVFETLNSKYVIDEANGYYRREPLVSRVTPQSHRLLYHTWIGMREYKIENGCLRIHALDSTIGILTTEILKEYEETFPEEDPPVGL